MDGGAWLIYAALGATQNLHTTSAQLHRTVNFPTSTGRAHSSLGCPSFPFIGDELTKERTGWKTDSVKHNVNF
ncbi:hypothetical protein CapIbe_011273 [Capra ibex]